MKDMSVADLCGLTAAATAAPGGGSIAAMAGAFAAALACMAARLTLHKPGYEETAEAMAQVADEAEALRLELLSDIQRDSEAYDAFLRAHSLPRDNEYERAARQAALQEALKNACLTPLAVGRKCLDALQKAATTVESGNRNTAADALAGVFLARAAVMANVNNILTNLAGVLDAGFTDRMKVACQELAQQADEGERAALLGLRARQGEV